MSSDINSEDFDFNDFIFDNDIEMIKVAAGRSVSLEPLPTLVSEGERKRLGIARASPNWSTGMLRRAQRQTLPKGEVTVRTPDPCPESFEQALNDYASDYHM